MLDEIIASAQDEHVSVGEIVDAFQYQAYGPLILIPSLFALIPVIGAIPGVSIATASLIILVSMQMLMARPHPWLPARIKRLSISQARLHQAISVVRPYLRKLDRWTHPRLLILSAWPFYLVVPVLCIVLALTMYPLALVPWGVFPLALALTVLSVGLTMRDGYVLASGYVLLTGAMVLAAGLI